MGKVSTSLSPSPTASTLVCHHCGLDAERPLYQKDDGEKKRPFCCYGCLSVFRLLNSKGLQDFYRLRQEGELFGPQTAATPIEGKFHFLDEKKFREDHAMIGERGLVSMRFYLEGINCIACLWLIERVPDFVDDIVHVHLDLSTSVMTMTTHADGGLAEGVRLVAAMGFRPAPLKRDEGHEKHAKSEDRRDLLRIGIAAAGSMNIMLYSIALYAGAPTTYGSIFSAIIIAFSLPVLTFSAYPFYQNAWASLKQYRVSLDVPIAFALVYGSVRGVVEILSGGVEYYFDTLTILVFLLLLSRFIVKKWGRKGLALDSLSPLLAIGPVEVDRQGRWVEVHPDYLEVDDRIRVKSGQVLPADGVLESEVAYLQTAMLTGESSPRKFVTDDEVLAGYQNSGEEVVLKLRATQAETKLGKLLEQVRRLEKRSSLFSSLADRVASGLVPIVLTTAALVVVYFWFAGDFLEGERRALSLIIITCPCALALATPLALARSLSLAQVLGIVMKDETLLERLHQVREVVLDKTGTITKGEFALLEENFFSIDQHRGRNLVLALERNSQHPISQCFKSSYAYEDVELEMQDVFEDLGRGVRGVFEGKQYAIGPSTHTAQNPGEIYLDLTENEHVVASFRLGDEVRQEASSIIDKWKKLNLNLWVLTGDHQKNANLLGEKLQLDRDRVKGDLLPHDKSTIVEQLHQSLMVGDGANDSLALRKATIGVAVKGSMELALKSADIFLTKPGLRPVADLLNLSQGTVELIKRNLKFSLIYNVAGASLAVAGFITPLTAAIIMPISSLTVVGSTIWANSKIRGLKLSHRGAQWRS